MIGKNQLQKVEIDQEAKKLYIYYIQDNSHLMSNPPPPPIYYREVYSFDDLKLEGKEYAEIGLLIYDSPPRNYNVRIRAW